MLADARVAIVGGGVAGCSLLYHLGQLGWEDVVLLEEDELTSGSTWHAAGLCTQFNPSYNMTGLLRYSVELYKTLAADYHECGSVAAGDDAGPRRRVPSSRRNGRASRRPGRDRRAGARSASCTRLIEVGDVLAAAYLPTDGHVDPSSLTRAFAATRRRPHLPSHAGDGARAPRRRLDAHDAEGRRPRRDRRRRRRAVGAERGTARGRRSADRLRSSTTTSSRTRSPR